MITKLIVFFGIITLAAIGWLFFGREKASQEISFITQTNSEGGVDVEVTPSKSSINLRFDVVLNTHSVELDQDMVQIAILKDDKGNEFLPLAWEGAVPGGHHREGTLIFPALTTSASKITLILNDIGEVPERNFSWELK